VLITIYIFLMYYGLERYFFLLLIFQSIESFNYKINSQLLRICWLGIKLKEGEPT